MSNNQKYVALPGGLTCKLVNRFHSLEHPHAHANIEATNPTYAITEVMPEGVEFDGSEVWQAYRNYGENKGWYNTSAQHGNSHISREYFVSHMNPVKNRIAIKPIKAINKRPDDVYPHLTKLSSDYKRSANLKEAIEAFLSIENGCSSEPEKAYHEGAEFGANWQQSQSIEGIIVFVLEWVAKKAELHYPTDPMGKGLNYITTDVNRPDILNMKSDIIKEYNNGKM